MNALVTRKKLLALKQSKEATEELKAIIDARVKEAWDVKNRFFDALMLYTLYNDFGFDRDRLIAFYRALDSEHKRMCELLGREDVKTDEHYAVFARYLKEYAGLDIDELYSELEKEDLIE